MQTFFLSQVKVLQIGRGIVDGPAAGVSSPTRSYTEAIKVSWDMEIWNVEYWYTRPNLGIWNVECTRLNLGLCLSLDDPPTAVR